MTDHLEIVPKCVEKVTEISLTVDQKRSIVDEYGDLDRAYREFKPQLDRREALGKQIKAWFEASNAEESVSFKGHRWIIQAGKRASETKIIDMATVLAFGGKQWFLGVASITLQALKARFTEEAYKKMVVVERTGSRVLKAVPQATSAPLAPAA